MNVLLIEDDEKTVAHLAEAFAGAQCRLDVATNGTDGLARAMEARHDVVVLDCMLPGMDGVSIVKSLRAAHVQTPIIYLTAVDGVPARVEGLDAGGDDYLVKPFAFVELLARVRALGRRPPAQAETMLQVGDLKFDLIKRSVTRAGGEIDLLPQELKLLEYFMRNPGVTLTKAMILKEVWNIHFDPRTSVVESHISRLRAKINPSATREFIRTIKNAGYVLNASR